MPVTELRLGMEKDSAVSALVSSGECSIGFALLNIYDPKVLTKMC